MSWVFDANSMCRYDGTPSCDQGWLYVPVAEDCFTRLVEVYGIPNQEATTVAKLLQIRKTHITSYQMQQNGGALL